MLVRLPFMIIFLSLALQNTTCQPPITDKLINPKTLLIYENDLSENYSNFLHLLKRNGHDFTSTKFNDESLDLKMYGEFAYDNVILMTNKLHLLNKRITRENWVEYVNYGGNLLILLDFEITPSMESLLKDFSIVAGKSSNVIDHFGSYASSNSMIKVSVKNIPKIDALYSNNDQIFEKGDFLLYEGVGLSYNRANENVISILHGGATSFVKPVINSKYPFSIGSATCLIAGVQMKNNARVTVVGSKRMFSDKFDILSSGRNGLFLDRVAQWSFRQRGVLKFIDMKHESVNEQDRHLMYTVGQNVFYSIDAYSFDLGKRAWVPYISNKIQLEFIRVDPFVRLNFNTSLSVPGRYEAQFKLPDVFGVFKFSIVHRVLGYTFVNHVTTTSVAPLRHDQHDRFLQVAYPYYISAFLIMFMTWFLIILLQSPLKEKEKTS